MGGHAKHNFAAHSELKREIAKEATPPQSLGALKKAVRVVKISRVT